MSERDEGSGGPRRNILLMLQYDGTGFSGWQEQPLQRTVQGEVEAAIEQMVRHPVTLRGASRTDSGVHAVGMPANFETVRDIPVYGFLRGLNATLPDDIAVTSAREVDLAFRARSAAVAKTYRYQIQTGPTRLPLWRDRSWYVRQQLDIEAMQRAADHLVGEHDFASFRAASCVSKSTTRVMYRVDVSRQTDPPLIRIDVTGNAFLQHMVRIMAGTLADVGKGKRSPASIADAFEAGERTSAGPTAPARGLTLMQVHFDGFPRVGKPPAP